MKQVLLAILFGFAATTPLNAGESKADVLEQMQGTWALPADASSGSASRMVKEIEGNKETFSIYRGEKLVYQHVVDFDVDLRDGVNVFTLRNQEVTAGPSKGQKSSHEFSYLFQVKEDQWVEVQGLMNDDGAAPKLTVYERVNESLDAGEETHSRSTQENDQEATVHASSVTQVVQTDRVVEPPHDVLEIDSDAQTGSHGHGRTKTRSDVATGHKSANYAEAWEYKILTWHNVPADKERTETGLNRLGAEGWEVTDIESPEARLLIFFLKRRTGKSAEDGEHDRVNIHPKAIEKIEDRLDRGGANQSFPPGAEPPVQTPAIPRQR